jgi:hypothetical protein
MDELGVARAIAQGELTSPQKYLNDLLLVAIRITGTGASYRPAKEEYVWRDASIYMNQEFLDRCNGLPVIFDHPKKTMLNTEEFRDRIVGTIFVPYLKPDVKEVWGIAKIFNKHAAELLTTEEMSTSPGVLCLGDKFPVGEDAESKKILIENKPFLLDHIALLIPYGKSTGAGVWDKGLGLSGVESVDATAIEDVDSPIDVILRKVTINQIVNRI